MNLKKKIKGFWNEYKYIIGTCGLVGLGLSSSLILGWKLGAIAEFESIAKGMEKMFEFNPEVKKIMFETAAKMDQT